MEKLGFKKPHPSFFIKNLGHDWFRSRQTPPAGLVRAALLCTVVLWIIGGATIAQADPTQSSQASASLGDLPLESLMQLEVPVVSSASKFAQKETAAPAFVTVVSSDDIKLYGYRTLADVLESVPAFNISYDRDYAYVGAQGISLGDANSRILVLVDGHRVNNDLTDGAYVDSAFILDLDLVDQVEIIQGPNAVLYGNNAFFGVINVVTRTGGKVNGLEASGAYGTYDSSKARVTYGRAFTNGLEMLLSGSIFRSSGNASDFYPAYDTPAQNNGVAVGLDDEWGGNVFGSLIYRDFSLEGAFNRRRKDIPTALSFTTFNDAALETTDDRGYVGLKYAHEFPKSVDLTARIYYDYAYHSIQEPLPNPAPFSVFKEDQTGEWYGSEVQLSKKLWDKHTLIVGAEYRDDFHQEDQSYFPQVPNSTTTTSASRHSWGVYGEGDLELFPKLHLNAGGRYDKYGSFSPEYDPRVALIYNPWEQSTFKAIYGTAFRAPNFVELSDPRFQNITPEQITSYQLVYEQGIDEHLRSSLAGFYNDMHNLIIFQNGFYGNIDADSKGVELAMEGVWTDWIRARASYTLQHANNLTTGQDLPDSPENMVKLNLSVPVVKEKVFASLEYQYTSSRHSFYTDSSSQTFPGMDASGFSVFNFTLFSRNILKNLEVSATAYNLLDKHYSDPSSNLHLEDVIPQDGRSFRVKVTYRF